jgi:hypothetical protein
MNNTEKRMLEILKELKSDCNVIAIKAEFEAEGSRTDELVKLNEIVFRADMDIYIKIGGCEAVRDLDQCRILGATGIMAPMIETPFAMEKFIGAINKVYSVEEQAGINFIFNAETFTCYQNIDAILAVKGIETMHSIAVGRVDLTGSLGYGRDMINSVKIYDMTLEFLQKAKAKGIMAGIGGGISIESIPFIKRLGSNLEKFETRKVVFKNDKEFNIEKGLVLAMEFEILYLKNKQALYMHMATEDVSRIAMMEKRFEIMKSQCHIN